jgi:hypothetical protein
MPGAKTIRVGAAKFVTDLNVSNGTAPTNSDHGVAIPEARKNEYCVFGAKKSNAATYDLYGMTQNSTWYVVETFAMTREVNEAEPLIAMGGFIRAASVRTDTNVQEGGHTNTEWGFIE